MFRQTLDDPDDFDAYHKWLGIPLNKRPPTYYQILGISPAETDPDTIAAAADRQEAFVRKFREGPLSAHASSILFQIDQARMTLLDVAARAKYDHTLNVARKRRRRIAFESEPIPPAAAGSHSIGEESGLAKQLLAIMSILGGGLIGIYLLTVYLPGRALENDPIAVQAPTETTQPPGNSPPGDPPGSPQPDANPPVAKQPIAKRPDPIAADANTTSPLANDAELIAFFKSVVASQRTCADAFNRVSNLLDGCVHNEPAEVGPLEAAMQEAGETVALVNREVDAVVVPEDGSDLQRLISTVREWITAENDVMHTAVPDAILVLKDAAVSQKERTARFAAIRRKAGTIENAANLALVETENAFFKNNRIRVPAQIAVERAQVKAAIASADERGRALAQSKPAGASGTEAVEATALLGGIADALAERFVALFNGRDLTGWRTHPKHQGRWRVESGILISPRKEVGSLYSEREDFGDFHLRVEARIDDKGDSGIWFRSPFDLKWPAGSPARPSGLEAQINSNGTLIRTGSLLIDGKAPDPVRQTSVRPGQWFTLEVIAEDNRIVVKVDGWRTASLTDNERRFRKGCIILQKADQTSLVEFRKIEILE